MNLYEITEKQKAERQLLITLQREVKEPFKSREGGGWKSTDPGDEDQFVWLNGNHVIIQTMDDSGDAYMANLINAILSMDNFHELDYMGSLTQAVGKYGYPGSRRQIGTHRYNRVEFKVVQKQK